VLVAEVLVAKVLEEEVVVAKVLGEEVLGLASDKRQTRLWGT
jgi:hypothetical protein